MAAIFGRSKKVDNQVVAPRIEETDVGLEDAGDASHSVELLPGITCGETALSELWGSNAILNDISNPAAQTENCLVLSATTNPFTQKHPSVLIRGGLSASGAGRYSGPPERRCLQDSTVASFRIQGRVKYCHNVGLIVMYLNVCGM